LLAGDGRTTAIDVGALVSTASWAPRRFLLDALVPADRPALGLAVGRAAAAYRAALAGARPSPIDFFAVRVPAAAFVAGGAGAVRLAAVGRLGALLAAGVRRVDRGAGPRSAVVSAAGRAAGTRFASLLCRCGVHAPTALHFRSGGHARDFRLMPRRGSAEPDHQARCQQDHLRRRLNRPIG
jgi:hypothetical protein